jgi:pyridoxal phosphate enzyme (YggS family)
MGAELVAERLAQVRDRIAKAGASPGSVRVVAVTKGFGPEAVEAAVGAGLVDLGENYAQELLWKAAAAPAGVCWHFLGGLQRNKLARLAPHVHLWHGLDSVEGALALARRRPAAAVLVQVNTTPAGGRPRPGGAAVSGASGLSRAPRHGASAAEVPALVESARAAGLDVRGLMAVGRAHAAREETRSGFRDVASLAGSLGLDELSMGMSADFDLAVAEGATIIRLGRALFGPRPPADVPGRDAARLG